MSLCPVILAGGGGTRLWPLSREYYPKHFLKLFGDKTLLQNTLLRLENTGSSLDVIDPLVICNETHRFLVAEQALHCKTDITNIILEPKGRNTAPALTVAALELIRTTPDSVIIVMPADHVIDDIAAFHNAIAAGYDMAGRDYLVTFGVKPDKPETGYGYIHSGERIKRINNVPINRLNGFVEKPVKSAAERYLASGDYFWNSGIFMLKASVWLEQIRRCRADIYTACETAYNKGEVDGLFYRLDEAAFLSCPSDSIDYAVMEKLSGRANEKLAVIPVNIGWSDVGAWSSVWELNQKDDDGNYIEGDVIVDSSSNCMIRSERGLIVAIACNDMVIIDSDDAIMIADKSRSQQVKKIVAALKDADRSESFLHRKVYRPWGSYTSVDHGDNFQVKRLTINPGKKLSLQLHRRRAEHWVVVTGTATVTRGEEVFELKQNESTFIPVETRHRLENAGDEILELIEVQSGAYLGEDDIVRFEDDFGRN